MPVLENERKPDCTGENFRMYCKSEAHQTKGGNRRVRESIRPQAVLTNCGPAWWEALKQILPNKGVMHQRKMTYLGNVWGSVIGWRLQKKCVISSHAETEPKGAAVGEYHLPSVSTAECEVFSERRSYPAGQLGG